MQRGRSVSPTPTWALLLSNTIITSALPSSPGLLPGSPLFAASAPSLQRHCPSELPIAPHQLANWNQYLGRVQFRGRRLNKGADTWRLLLSSTLNSLGLLGFSPANGPPALIIMMMVILIISGNLQGVAGFFIWMPW